jgi:dienelactone hydrolase
MTKGNPAVLEAFTKTPFTALGRTRDVYRLGSGPTVLILSEMPGITPSLVTFAKRVMAQGFSVAIPHLFGRDGNVANNGEFLKTFGEVCVSREFTLFATGKSSRVTQWLNELARHEHQVNGGPGVGVIGMCLTGGFALAMMVDPVVVAPVLSQPSLPIGRKDRHKSDPGISAEEMAKVKARTENGVCVMAYRFSGDKLSPGQRFENLRNVLGDGFIGVEIDSTPGNEWGYPADAHSVFTEGQDNKAGSPTTQAMNELLNFFTTRLAASA